ncbi:hypothetical protein LS68_002525 [Helicobacter sp. MIT 05-5293]|uniref:hypothetical protein n=1 Tax=Helicobacter sp. MIT 05-5293 TaxID=1548149 RepID=UPI00051DDF20|nr:hypothetical protein [Helicobacter sp. MIT 05-5293]TLD81910.1 hypothetical protein LS68_002525 [Helicobacter sp. MIT 05-5293]
MQELNWLINICFTIFMVGLFVWDFKTFGEPTHKDFKAIIMSTGVLGTFVGIFVGLMGFDTRALQDSVPLLLDGLKTAFYTSIMGMGLAIALSIIQRARGIKSSQDANMDYMIYQVGNLNYLKGIEEISKNMANLPTKNDMIQINSTTNALLESSLKKIDVSLQEAIKQLASGASKELIAALELVIRDFNHNLQDQFGDNFKELNVAVGRLLTWQEHYKDSIEQTQTLLTQTHNAMNDTKEAMSNTQKTLDSITQQNITAMEFYTKTLEMINELKAKGDLLQAQLQEVANLGDNAKKSLNDVNHFFIQTSESFKNLEDSVTQNVEEMKNGLETHLDHLDEYTQGNVETLRKFLETSSMEAGSNTSAMLQQHTSLFRTSLEEMAGHTDEVLKNVMNTANTQLERLSNELEKNIQQNIESNTHNSAEFARLREHIAKNHTAIVESLESSLTKLNGYNEQIMQDMSKGLKGMQDMYLSTLTASMDSVMNKEQELIHNRMESMNELAHKTDANLNAQYENTNQFLKKIATEYLKIMQKLTKDSVAIPKDMGVQVVKDFGDLQHNLLSHLGNLNAQIQHNSMQLIELYRNVQKILNENIDGNKHLQQEIKSTFSSLDESMSASMENFKENYEWFLRRVREIIGSR